MADRTERQPSHAPDPFGAFVGHRMGFLPRRVYDPAHRWAVGVVRMLARRNAYGVPRGRRTHFTLTFVGGTADATSLHYQRAPVTVWVSYTVGGARIEMPLRTAWVRATDDDILAQWNATEPERQEERRRDEVAAAAMTASIMRGEDPQGHP